MSETFSVGCWKKGSCRVDPLFGSTAFLAAPVGDHVAVLASDAGDANNVKVEGQEPGTCASMVQEKGVLPL